MSLLRLLLIILLFIFPLGELVRIPLAQNIFIKPLDVIAGLVTIAYFLIGIQRKKLTINIWPFFVFPLFGLIALILNVSWLHINEVITSIFYLIRWLIYLSIYFALTYVSDSFKKTYRFIIIFTGVITLCISFIQYFYYGSLIPWISQGWDNHLYRLFGTFLDPNFIGAFFTLYFIYLAGIFYSICTNKNYQNVVLFNKFPIKKIHLLLSLSFLMVASVIADFLTFSRSSLLMLLVCTMIFLILIGRKKLIFLMLLFLAFFIIKISPFFYVENMNLFRGASSIARVGNYQEGLSVFIDKPIFGIGFDTYRYAKTKYGIPNGWVNAPSHADAGVDNSFLFVLITSGIVGFFGYLFMWFVMLQKSTYFYRKNKNVDAIVFISSVFGLFFHSLFINSLFFPELMMWMWILYGLLPRTYST